MITFQRDGSQVLDRNILGLGTGKDIFKIYMLEALRKNTFSKINTLKHGGSAAES